MEIIERRRYSSRRGLLGNGLIVDVRTSKNGRVSKWLSNKSGAMQEWEWHVYEGHQEWFVVMRGQIWLHHRNKVHHLEEGSYGTVETGKYQIYIPRQTKVLLHN